MMFNYLGMMAVMNVNLMRKKGSGQKLKLSDHYYEINGSALFLISVFFSNQPLTFETSFCAGYVEDEEQTRCWDHNQKEKE